MSGSWQSVLVHKLEHLITELVTQDEPSADPAVPLNPAVPLAIVVQKLHGPHMSLAWEARFWRVGRPLSPHSRASTKSAFFSLPTSIKYAICLLGPLHLHTTTLLCVPTSVTQRTLSAAPCLAPWWTPLSSAHTPIMGPACLAQQAPLLIPHLQNGIHAACKAPNMGMRAAGSWQGT